jgi:hypothetical protein
MEKITFVLSDSSIVNRYGFRVMTSGIRLEAFRNNPIMLYMHKRKGHDMEWEHLPIGIWENIRVEGTKLLADAVFDEEDEFAMKIARKVEKGMLRAVSAGLDPLDWSFDDEYILQGQERPTLTLSEMREASIVDIPSNANCVRLYGKTATVTLGAGMDNEEDLAKILPQKPNKPDNMEEVALKLGLPKTASAADIAAALDKQQTEKEQAEQKLAAESDKLVKLSAEKADLEKKLKDAEENGKKEKAKSLVETALAAGKISAPEKDSFIALAEGNYDAVKSILDAKKAYQPLSTQLSAGSTTAADGGKASWTFEDYQKKAPVELSDMRSNNWEQYAQLFKAQFGTDPKKD